MKQYDSYSVEDFVNDSRFRSWVRNPSREQDDIWQKWLLEHPDQRDVVAEARAIILAIHPVHNSNISDREIEAEIGSILDRIDYVQPGDAGFLNGEKSKTSYWWAVAASLIIVAVSGWLVVRYVSDRSSIEFMESFGDASTDVSDDYMIERVNKSGDPLLISLPDNSSVLLSQNSVVRYPRLFRGDSREVFLDGTAFFEVTRDPDRPFFVNAGKIIAKVLGTSFEISTDEVRKQVSVIVKSGTVSIYSNDGKPKGGSEDEPKVILTRHEQFIFKDEESQVQHTRLDSTAIKTLRVPDTYLTFKATPAKEVLQTLAKAYGVKLNLDKADVDDCSVTASFTDEPFPLKLELICRSIGVQYEIVNDQVTIIGDGCEN
jgi:hypothetical protein